MKKIPDHVLDWLIRRARPRRRLGGKRGTRIGRQTDLDICSDYSRAVKKDDRRKQIYAGAMPGGGGIKLPSMRIARYAQNLPPISNAIASYFLIAASDCAKAPAAAPQRVRDATLAMIETTLALAAHTIFF